VVKEGSGDERGSPLPVAAGAGVEPSMTLLFFFDVLGFSERVRELGLEAIHAKYEELLERVHREGSQLVLDAGPDGVAFVCSISWRMTYFSDTILLWTDYSRGPLIMNAARGVACRFFCDCLQMGLPLRGAMACGPAIMDADRGIYLGEPIVDAARAEAAQSCAGIGIANSWGHHFGGALGRAEGLLEYSDHMKPGREEALASIVLDWPRMWRDDPRYKDGDLEAIFASLSRPGFESYWDRTRELVAFSVVNEDWFLRRQRDADYQEGE
jgi:hypothetical protein